MCSQYLTQKFKTSKQEWQEFREYVQAAVATSIDSLSKVDAAQSEIKQNLDTLKL
jgi:hypothetical protein